MLVNIRVARSNGVPVVAQAVRAYLVVRNGVAEVRSVKDPQKLVWPRMRAMRIEVGAFEMLLGGPVRILSAQGSLDDLDDEDEDGHFRKAPERPTVAYQEWIARPDWSPDVARFEDGKTHAARTTQMAN